MGDYTNVIYDKKTKEVLVFESNGHWVIPVGYDVAQFKNGAEPVLTKDSDGRVYIKPNTLILTDY